MSYIQVFQMTGTAYDLMNRNLRLMADGMAIYRVTGSQSVRVAMNSLAYRICYQISELQNAGIVPFYTDD